MKHTDNRKKQLTPELLDECKKLKHIFDSKKRELKISQGSIADVMGVNQSSVSHYLNGVNALNANAAAMFAKILNVDVSEFSERLAKELKDFVNLASNTNSTVQTSSRSSDVNLIVYRYPVINWISVGLGNDVWQPEFVEEHINTDVNAGKKGFWLKVKNDSMTAAKGISFPEGMYILINPDADIKNESYVIAKIIDTHEVAFIQCVEEAGVKYLKPLNNSYKTQELDERWQIVGKVVDARWRL